MFVNTVTMKNNQNVLIIFASPHSNGHTRRSLNTFLAKNNITEYTFFDCYTASPYPCVACGSCASERICIHRDLDEFYNMLENATRLIIAFPVYNAGLPSPLKAVFDRLQVYYSARFVRGENPPITIPKTVDIITTCGSSGKGYEKLLKAQILPALTVINGKLDSYSEVLLTDKK